MKHKSMKIKGAPVKDATRELHIQITDRDVKEGAKKNATSCAAAHALVRTGVCDQARVHVNRTYIKKGDKWLRFKTPPALRSEIVAFDRGGSFEPGEYKLMPLSPSQKTGIKRKHDAAMPERSRKSKGIKPPQKRKPHITTGVRQRFNAGGRIV